MDLRNLKPEQVPQDVWHAVHRALYQHAPDSPVIVSTRTMGVAIEILAARAAERERCAKICEAERDKFLSPQYASNQPLGSLCERFACDECAAAIRGEHP